MTSIEDIAYTPKYAWQILTDRRRCWCLLKLRYIDPDTKSPYIIAQWDPIFKGGSWILCNQYLTVITVDDATKCDVIWFVVLG